MTLPHNLGSSMDTKRLDQIMKRAEEGLNPEDPYFRDIYHLVGEVRKLKDAPVPELSSRRDEYYTQVGMAVGVVNHSLDHYISDMNLSIYHLRRWAEANPDLVPLYNTMRRRFEIIQDQLSLLYPLNPQLSRRSSPIKFHQISSYLYQAFSEVLQNYDIELKIRNDFDDLVWTIRRSTLVTVFVNLIDNAITHLKDWDSDRKILLEAHDKGVVVRDTGPGIPEDLRDSIFDRGVTTKAHGEGGLGLYICKKTLQEEGFNLSLIEVEEGTCFLIENKKE